MEALGPEPFDLVVGCDLMYVAEAIPALVESLRALAALGRGRGGETGGGDGGGGGGGGAASSVGVGGGGRRGERAGGGAGGSGSAAAAAAAAGADANASDGAGAAPGQFPPPPWPAAEVLIAHGRNRGAEPAFLEACRGVFDIARVPPGELDGVYQCSDVDVLRLRLLQ